MIFSIPDEAQKVLQSGTVIRLFSNCKTKASDVFRTRPLEATSEPFRTYNPVESLVLTYSDDDELLSGSSLY